MLRRRSGQTPKKCNFSDPMAKARTGKSRAASSKVGGPAMGLGHDYQVDYAILCCARMIGDQLGHPFDERFIAVEPRAIAPEATTAWDLSLHPEEILIEAKATPKKADVIDWLERSAKAPCGSMSQFVHSESCRLLRGVVHLARLAAEASSDEGLFVALIENDRPTDADVIRPDPRVPSCRRSSRSSARAEPCAPARRVACRSGARGSAEK